MALVKVRPALQASERDPSQVAENQTSVGNVVAVDEDIPADVLNWSLSGAGADDWPEVFCW